MIGVMTTIWALEISLKRIDAVCDKYGKVIGPSHSSAIESHYDGSLTEAQAREKYAQCNVIVSKR